jgi:hypothetical protein
LTARAVVRTYIQALTPSGFLLKSASVLKRVSDLVAPVKGVSMSLQAHYGQLSSRSISLSAEGIAAAQFARTGFDILPQAAHEKPNYDLAVTRAGSLVKMSVRATDNGRWDLVTPFLRGVYGSKSRRADHQNAIDLWLDSQSSRAMCCLVQFGDVPLDQLPRIYLAAPGDVARRMRDTLERLDDASLYEAYEWTSPFEGVQRMETLPNAWRFSPERIQELLTSHHAAEVPVHGLRHRVPAETRHAAKPIEVLREVALTA